MFLSGSLKRVFLSAFYLFLLCLPLYSLSNGESPSSAEVSNDYIYPLKVNDGLGNSMTLESQPQSIASLTLFSDELLFSLVSPERLKAITFLASDPVYSNVAHRAEEVERSMEFAVEPLIELYPDIIFTANWSDAGKVEQLRNAGLKVYQVNTPVTINDIEQEILKIGGILGEGDKARALVKTMEGQLSRLSDKLAELEEDERLVALDYSSWEASSGKNSSWDEILKHAGLINGAAVYENDQFGQVPMSRELLVEIDPDILFLPGWVYGDPEGAERFLQSIKKDPALVGMKAVQQDRVYLVPENLKSTYSQYITEACQFIAEIAYPQLFE